MSKKDIIQVLISLRQDWKALFGNGLLKNTWPAMQVLFSTKPSIIQVFDAAILDWNFPLPQPSAVTESKMAA